MLILDIPSLNHPRRALTILLGGNDAGGQGSNKSNTFMEWIDR
jgi:hypothetical protein